MVGEDEVQRLHGDVLDEMKLVAASIDVPFEDSGVPHNAVRPNALDPQAAVAGELRARLGTEANPVPGPRVADDAVPICEYRSKGYMTLAFPTLFPFGRGYFDQTRSVDVSWQQWSQHLERYHDLRFATHRRFPYFVLNTHERKTAMEQARKGEAGSRRRCPGWWGGQAGGV